MNVAAIKAGSLALVSQGAVLLVGYGIVNNAQAAKWSAITVAILNAVFLVIHAWHAQTEAKK